MSRPEEERSGKGETMEVNKKLYENYVKEITPVHSKGVNML